MHRYLAEISTRLDCPAIVVGGLEDHVHPLARQARTITLADWIKDRGRNPFRVKGTGLMITQGSPCAATLGKATQRLRRISDQDEIPPSGRLVLMGENPPHATWGSGGGPGITSVFSHDSRLTVQGLRLTDHFVSRAGPHCVAGWILAKHQA